MIILYLNVVFYVQVAKKNGVEQEMASFLLPEKSTVNLEQNEQGSYTFDRNSLLWVVIVCVNVCVHTATCEGSAAVRERASIQSRPQAELSIGLVKVQGYR